MDDDVQNAAKRLQRLDAAFADPIKHFDMWLDLGGDATRVMEEVQQLVDDTDHVGTDVARFALAIRTPQSTLNELAARHKRTGSALSQRRTRLLSALAMLGVSSAVQRHPVRELMTSTFHRMVRLEDIHPWWRMMLDDPRGEQPWASKHDVARVMVTLAVGRPWLVPAESTNADAQEWWLVDRGLIDESDRKPTLRDAFEAFADQATPNGSVEMSFGQFHSNAVAWGVAPVSVTSFRERLEKAPTRRAVAYMDRVAVLSASTARRAGSIAAVVMKSFGLDEATAARLVADRQGRNVVAVINDLRQISIG